MLCTSNRMYGLTIISAIILIVLFGNGMLESSIQKIATPMGGDANPMMACIAGGVTLIFPGLFLATAGYLHEYEINQTTREHKPCKFKVHRKNADGEVVSADVLEDELLHDDEPRELIRQKMKSSKFATASISIGLVIAFMGFATLIMGCAFDGNEAAWNNQYLTIPLVVIYSCITLAGVIGCTALNIEKYNIGKQNPIAQPEKSLQPDEESKTQCNQQENGQTKSKDLAEDPPLAGGELSGVTESTAETGRSNFLLSSAKSLKKHGQELRDFDQTADQEPELIEHSLTVHLESLENNSSFPTIPEVQVEEKSQSKRSRTPFEKQFGDLLG